LINSPKQTKVNNLFNLLIARDTKRLPVQNAVQLTLRSLDKDLDLIPLVDVPAARFKALDPNKLRGGYYTSPEVAQWLCRWAIRAPNEHVLEPSCGNGIFLEAAAKRLRNVGASQARISRQIVGVEIVSREAEVARKRLTDSLGKHAVPSVFAKDFFGWWHEPNRPSFDVIVGNPPFIRYQSFPEPSRARAMHIMKSLGLSPNKLTNIWVPFVAAAVACLKPSGRLALVLPAELMQVTYASQLRSFLADKFGRIDIVACNHLFFDNAEQEVVLVLADNARVRPSSENVCRVALTEGESVSDILTDDPAVLTARAQPKSIQHDSEKWLKYFLTEGEIDLMRLLRATESVVRLSSHANVDIGVVTGKNEFFVLAEDQVKQYGLDEFVIPLVARSAHLEGTKFTKPHWHELARRGERVFLLYPNGHLKRALPKAFREYIRHGEARAYHKGYKCSIRKPWYSVPSVWNPDCFLFRQIYDFPRVVLNEAGATSTDTIHRMKCRTTPEIVAANLYTHLTAASAEIEGRSYGGGVLELEPNEADSLLVPAKLAMALPLDECDRLVRAGRLVDVLAENDRLVLRGVLGLSKSECVTLHNIWVKMRDRRMNRRRRRPTPPASTEAAK